VTLLVVGSIVGSGIFFLPGPMLESAGTVPLVFAAWIGGALIALCGGLMFAELGAAYPKGGGQYAFLRQGLGKLPAFLFSWTAFTIVQSSAIASISVAFASATNRVLSHMGLGLPGSRPCLGELADGACVGFALPPWGEGFLAVGTIVLLSVVNHRGVKLGARVNTLATLAKLGALALLIVLVVPLPDAGNFTSATGQAGAATVAGFGLALALSLFAYDGFAQATFIAPEVKDARRVLPRAILTASIGVAALYLVTTFAYFHVLPANNITIPALRGDAPIAIEVMEAAFSGPLGVGLAVGVAVAIAVSTFGTVNAYVLASPRIYHAVAKDKEFPSAFGVLSRHRTPTYGLWYGAVWAGILTMTGGFEALAHLAVFGLYSFYLVTVVAYFALRRREPQAFTSFRAPLSPVPAVLFGLGSLYVLWTYVSRDVPALGQLSGPLDVLTNTTLFGLLLIASGLAVRRFMKA
jgi:basic amino acid/polyamine antiporter, APA family